MVYAFEFDEYFDSRIYTQFISYICYKYPILLSKIHTVENDYVFSFRNNNVESQIEIKDMVNSNKIDAYLLELTAEPISKKGFLFKCYIIPTEDKTYVVNLFDHVVVDGYSTTLFINEMTKYHDQGYKDERPKRGFIKTSRSFKYRKHSYDRFWRYELMSKVVYDT